MSNNYCKIMYRCRLCGVTDPVELIRGSSGCNGLTAASQIKETTTHKCNGSNNNQQIGIAEVAGIIDVHENELESVKDRIYYLLVGITREEARKRIKEQNENPDKRVFSVISDPDEW